MKSKQKKCLGSYDWKWGMYNEIQCPVCGKTFKALRMFGRLDRTYVPKHKGKS